MNKIIYLDTNIFLHYQPFTQINWLELVTAESVTIVIPPVIIRELNKQKDSQGNPKKRKRAAETIKKLFELSESDNPSQVADGIEIYLEDREPSFDFAKYQLNFDIQDDHLIASILSNKLENPAQNIVLITSDLGLQLNLKARRIGVDTLTMPEKFKIADELDPNEIKIKKLEQENRELRSRAPVLSLLFENGNQNNSYKLTQPVTISENEIEDKVAEKKSVLAGIAKGEKNKKIDLSAGELGIESVINVLSSNLIPREEIQRYNSDFELFIPKYKEYLTKNLDYDNLTRRIIELKISLTNNGTAPAEDVDIYLSITNSFQFLLEDDLPKPPEPPIPPEEPKTEMQIIAESLRSGLMLQATAFPIYNPTFSQIKASDSSNRSMKRTSNNEVQVHIQKIKHNFQEPLGPLFVVFNDYESAKSFNINYRILAANIPHEITGSLNVVIEKE
jgi:rRNA-processing protein FCF1